MAESIPFTPGIPHQRLEVTLAGVPMIIDARWNSRDEAFYLDVFDVGENPIARGVKVVLGALLGRGNTHPFFYGRALFAVDKSGTGRECGLDDLGARIILMYLTEVDLLLASQPALEIPKQ